jgi:hypothetical protein
MAVEYEFGGPVGTLATMLGLPITIWGLFLTCNDKAAGCPTWPQLPAGAEAIPAFLAGLYSHEAMAVFVLWFAFLVVLWAVVPGAWIQGVELPSSGRLQYKMNGMLSGAVATACLAAAHWHGSVLGMPFDLVWIYKNYVQLATASMVFSIVLSVLLYVAARRFPRDSKFLAAHGNSGNPIYDFFMGNELNPRIGQFDFKEFCELRPGLIGWAVINAACLLHQYRETGTVTYSMWLVNGFQLYYVIDALLFEPAILTTMDITTDGFGFMLAFGDLAWVPFTYSLQARYLATYKLDEDIDWRFAMAIVGVKLLGLWIFRGSNSEKNRFRTNPNDPAVAHLKTMPTERGTKLIISGWWGIARHINYFGDWVMAWAWCLPCGFDSIIPYFYVVYFAGLLVHREMRDEAFCRHKYGKDWDKYCAIVRSRIIPYVY